MTLTAFSPENSQQVIKLFTDVFSESEGDNEGRIIGQLVAELISTTHPKDLLGYVSISGDIIEGCIFFSRLILPGGKTAFILSPVAVASRQQGKGLGQKLINYGIQQLISRNVELVFTYGDPAFYAKTGFRRISEDIVQAPRKLSQPDGWLARSLTAEDIAAETGPAQCVAALDKQMYW